MTFEIGDTANEKNPRWMGDDVGYIALHGWIKKNKPKPELCEICNERPVQQLSSNNHTYERDITKWQWVCIPCHQKKDDYYEKNIERCKTLHLGKKHSAETKQLMKEKRIKWLKSKEGKLWREKISEERKTTGIGKLWSIEMERIKNERRSA